MSTTHSLLLLRVLQFCCILIFINLDRCTSNTNTYLNEICSPENWMVISGDWSFTNSCAITNDLTGNNIAILPFKSWTYLNTVQDPTYELVIEYNFTITAASANNTIGSVGVLWFPDSAPNEVHDYMGVSFEENEAFVARTSGLDPDPYYNNIDQAMSNERDANGSLVVVWKEYNEGALPLRLSVNTLYSLRMEIYSITDRYAKHDIFINNRQVLSQERTYTSVGQHNTSWIGLKSSNASVISHSLTVHQASNPNSGDSVIQYFTEPATDMKPSTTTSQTDEATTDHDADTLSPRVSEDAVHASGPDVADESLFVPLFNMSIALLCAILAAVLLCLCCCGAAIVVLLRTPLTPKSKKMGPKMKTERRETDTQTMIEEVHISEPGGLSIQTVPSVPALPPATVSEAHIPANITMRGSMSKSDTDMVTTNGECELEGEIDLRRMETPDGQMSRSVYCGVCDVAIDNVRVFVVDGVRYCSGCHMAKLKQESLENEELYGNCGTDSNIDHDGSSDDLYDNGEDLCTVKGTATSKGNMQTVQGTEGKVDLCQDCGVIAAGKNDEDGSFFCDECWKMYENQNNTKGFIE